MKAPAPSPNRMQVDLSSQLIMRDRVSDPITRALRMAPVRIDWAAMFRAKMKPEQAAGRSKEPARPGPRAAWSRPAGARRVRGGRGEFKRWAGRRDARESGRRYARRTRRNWRGRSR